MSYRIYYQPVNTLTWNIFEKVHRIGHEEPFYATRSMTIGDRMLLYVGTQDKRYESGVYAWGTIVTEPYIMGKSDLGTEGLLYVDVRIDYMQWNTPIVPARDAKWFITSFRRVHQLNPQDYDLIQSVVFDAPASENA